MYLSVFHKLKFSAPSPFLEMNAPNAYHFDLCVRINDSFRCPHTGHERFIQFPNAL